LRGSLPRAGTHLASCASIHVPLIEAAIVNR